MTADLMAFLAAHYQRAERKGLLDRQALADVIAGLDVISPSVIVPGGAA